MSPIKNVCIKNVTVPFFRVWCVPTKKRKRKTSSEDKADYFVWENAAKVVLALIQLVILAILANNSGAE